MTEHEAWESIYHLDHSLVPHYVIVLDWHRQVWRVIIMSNKLDDQITDYIQDHSYELLEEWMLLWEDNKDAVLEAFLESDSKAALSFYSWAEDKVRDRMRRD